MKTKKLKSIGEPPKTPLLEPAREYRRLTRVEVTEHDWTDMNRQLEYERHQQKTRTPTCYRPLRHLIKHLHHMHSIDEERASKPTEDEWEAMIGELETIRVTTTKEYLLEMLFFMKLFDERRSRPFVDQYWSDLKLRGLIILLFLGFHLFIS